MENSVMTFLQNKAQHLNNAKLNSHILKVCLSYRFGVHVFVAV
jgi:hypothetical protein